MTSRYLLSSVFGRSPIGPIKQHIASAHGAAALLEPFFQAVMKEDWQKVESYQKRIVEFEEDADEIKKQVRLSLPKSLFLPVPRTDLLDLVTVQDKVANRAKDIAGIVLGRQMVFPTGLQPDFMLFVKRSVEASAQALRAINELDDLLETGFRGREADIVETMIEELNALEASTDKLQITVRRLLFAREKELPPIDVMFLYQVIEWVGDLADRASRVGGYLHMLLAH
ncbi:TIGR00153 family protein [Parendozoicomonas sp. Alg238-R29]|uniref:TIGR00153 family protein n=1 Tax=Parendozoicomonas sp. Alg238-R29 TaxID=2993446 RepID=UPI00248E5CFD|nr:TIGR00153 family protein [Parendozoicomonas sp. Alg238-R29]